MPDLLPSGAAANPPTSALILNPMVYSIMRLAASMLIDRSAGFTAFALGAG
jgi:hypothetical protein